MANRGTCTLLAAIFLFGAPALNASLIFDRTYALTSPTGQSDAAIRAQVFSTYNSDPYRYEWRYTVTNLSFSNLLYGNAQYRPYGIGSLYMGLPSYPGPDPAWQVFPYRDYTGFSSPAGFYWYYPGAATEAPSAWTNLSGGLLPGQTGTFTFSTYPRLITEGLVEATSFAPAAWGSFGYPESAQIAMPGALDGTPLPEPATWTVAIAGLGIFALRLRKKTQ